MITTTKCQECGRPIKRVLTWNGRELGIECWKKIAIPELEAQKQARREAWERERWEKSYALAEALRQKDFTKIKSEFKIKFLHELIEQFDEKGFISPKQEQMVRGVGWNGSFTDHGMLNNQDNVNENIALYLVGNDEQKEYVCATMRALGYSVKLKKQFEEATGADVKFYGKD